MASNVARFYGIELEENKPENLFKRVREFVDIMDKSRRKLIKLEKERQKIAAKRAKDREKLRKQRAKSVGQHEQKSGVKFNVAEAVQRKRMEENAKKDKGNLLFHDIRKEAGKRQQLEDKLKVRLTMHFKEVQALAKGQELPSVRKDSIKQRCTMMANKG